MSSSENIKAYIHIRKYAREIASRFSSPVFYKKFKDANNFSSNFFKTNSIVRELREFVFTRLENDFGHGLKHAVKVSLDAGALMIIECTPGGYSNEEIRRRVCIAQCAGLLHDIKRKEKNHAAAGAVYAAEVLKSYPFTPAEIQDICNAIHNHEAFKEILTFDRPERTLLSDCLYDADKFRWGSDNFTDTVWDMVMFSQTPLKEFIKRYPDGMKSLERIKNTFRSNTGKKYGPEFIDIGLAIGKELFKIIQDEFS
ncbi:HD domain-containing protein [Desulfonema limicola]|uniref:HD domain-containing protein n=1 Tax=Desulfonema limicola TaxID=45656 RepID=A0A975GEP9_9BACT|nr:HD domain-containing protein [Desulfonema limicola]QTA78360.1 HD domain-containing protein [Desulfonema limicola]